MPWTKLDDHFWSNPKIQALPSDTARWLYVAALNWSVGNLTDGRITTADAQRLINNPRGNRAATALRSLTKCGLFVPDVHESDVWWIHDFHDYQYSKDHIEQRRKDDRERQARRRERLSQRDMSQRDSDVTPDGVLDLHPIPTQPSIPLSSLTHTTPPANSIIDLLNNPPEDDDEERESEDEQTDWAFPPEGAIIDLWRQAVTTTLHHQDTSTIRDPHAYTAAIYRNLLTEHHANLENNALVDAIADCPECDTNGLRWSTATNKPTRQGTVSIAPLA